MTVKNTHLRFASVSASLLLAASLAVAGTGAVSAYAVDAKNTNANETSSGNVDSSNTNTSTNTNSGADVSDASIEQTDLIIDNTDDGDELTAVRIINTSIVDGAITRVFADGFSYGSNASKVGDSGLDAYTQLTEADAISAAADGFLSQVTDASETYHAESKDGCVTFKNLPTGQYLVFGTNFIGKPCINNMIVSLEPSVKDNAYILPPVTVTAKNLANPTPPKLEIDKTVNKQEFTKGEQNPEYKVVIKQVNEAPANNIYASDELSPETIVAGLRINKDVVITDTNGNVVQNATVTYKMNSDGRPVGFEVYVPGKLEQNAELIATYTGDISTLENHQDNLDNIAKTHSDDADEVSDDEKIIYNYDGGMNDLLAQLGDKLPIVLGVVGIVAIGGVIVIIVRRKKRDEL